MQLACQHARRQGQAGRSREFGRAHLPRSRRRRPVRRRARRHDRLDEPRRPGADASTATSCRWPRPTPARSPRSGTAAGRSSACSSTPRSATRPTAASILRNFLYDVCGCQRTVADAVVHRADRRASCGERIGSHRVICGLSGGVDSSVTAALLLRAIGAAGGVHLRGQRPAAPGRGRGGRAAPSATTSTPTCTSSTPASAFSRPWPASPIRRRSASIIGHVFIDVFKDEAQRIQNARFLAQGTLYPDVIESGAAADGPAATIKTHHNVGGLPKELGFELIEPLQGPVQGRGAPARPGAGPAGETGLAASVPRPRPGGALPRRGHRGAPGDAAPGRRDPAGRTEASGLVSQDGAGLRGAAAGAIGRRDGRRPNLRERRSPCGPCRRTTS